MEHQRAGAPRHTRRHFGRIALGGAVLAAGGAASWQAIAAADAGGPGPAADPDGIGPVTLATGKDTTGYLQKVLTDWNTAHPHEPATLVQLPEDADEVHAEMVDELRSGGSQFDVLNLDVVWTAEFAAQGWIAALDEQQFALDRFLPPVLAASRYTGRLYSVPYVTNAAMLYYRSDILTAAGQLPPTTWAELARQSATLAPAHRIDGYAGQLWPYEGLTVNALEAIRSAGGDLLDPSGRVVVDSPQARTGLDFLAGGLRDGWIPQAALGYQEEQSRAAFQSGKLLFLRNWPYVYPEAEDGARSAVAGRFGVVALPGPHGPGSEVLGGSCLAVCRYSRNQGSARALIRYMTSRQIQSRVLTEGGLPPVWADLYQDPELVARFPYLPVLRRAVLVAGTRPAIPQYQQLSLAFSESAYEVLRGRWTAAAGLARLAGDLRQIVG